MWLDANIRYSLVRQGSEEHVVPWRVDIKALVDVEKVSTGEPQWFVVGRILADELRRYEIEEWGDSVWDAADADSSGLESAYASLLDKDGAFRSDEFEGVGDPVVYLYRFVLHEAFSSWRMAVLDGFCRLFPNDAVIVAQHHTTWFSLAEFEALGFRDFGPREFPPPKGFMHIDRDTRFLVRENAAICELKLKDYPKDAPPANAEHEAWVASAGPWEGLC